MKRIYYLFLLFFMLNSCYIREVVINSQEHYDIKYPKVFNKCEVPLNLGNNLYTIETERGIIVRQKNEMIYFGLSSAILYDKFLDVVDSMKLFLDNNTNVILIVEGHSDKEGGEGRIYKNAELSKNRVSNVINRFSNYNDRVIAYYFGDYIPYFTNTLNNQERASRNRRVEFVVIKCEKDYNRYNDSISAVYNKTLQDYNTQINSASLSLSTYKP